LHTFLPQSWCRKAKKWSPKCVTGISKVVTTKSGHHQKWSPPKVVTRPEIGHQIRNQKKLCSDTESGHHDSAVEKTNKTWIASPHDPIVGVLQQKIDLTTNRLTMVVTHTFVWTVVLFWRTTIQQQPNEFVVVVVVAVQN
jgi:hypothetical protein